MTPLRAMARALCLSGFALWTAVYIAICAVWLVRQCANTKRTKLYTPERHQAPSINPNSTNRAYWYTPGTIPIQSMGPPTTKPGEGSHRLSNNLPLGLTLTPHHNSYA